ncbi:MAG TPA: hypothetical protein VM223_01275 [Planctomycetota bacterium]|nr:hypothetical protein [Planctomycetota bacterium]
MMADAPVYSNDYVWELERKVERLKAERDEFPDRPSMAREIVRIQQLYQRSQDTAARLEREIERLKARVDQLDNARMAAMHAIRFHSEDGPFKALEILEAAEAEGADGC